MFDIEAATTDVLDSLIVYHKDTIRVLLGGVGREGSIQLWKPGGWVNGELQVQELGLLARIDKRVASAGK